MVFYNQRISRGDVYRRVPLVRISLAVGPTRSRAFEQSSLVCSMMLGEPIGMLQSGEAVFDSNPSHVEGHPTVIPILPEALLQIKSDLREHICEEVDFNRTIGDSICVETVPTDEILYALRKNRNGLTRFVNNRAPEPCSSAVVILQRAPDGSYVLVTAFIGKDTPPEPWDSDAATAESLPFWMTHALVWGHAEIIAGSETLVCPWDLARAKD
jgi:hypothetical protein